jgi:hypothetical protein
MLGQPRPTCERGRNKAAFAQVETKREGAEPSARTLISLAGN